jgi:hypothetical protein
VIGDAVKIQKFKNEGVVSLRLYSILDILKLRSFAYSWISKNFISQGIGDPIPRKITNYHRWAFDNSIPHEKLFSAPFRFTSPPEEIRRILLNTNLFKFFSSLGLKNPKVIDEGMGWLGYRMIRPGMNDGYPISCKNWGASKGAYSLWVPLYTFNSEYSLKFVKGSSQRSYLNYLPEDGKFTKDELRLDPSEKVTLSSVSLVPGQALFYHPNTLHSENVPTGNKTRLNLEFRFLFE